MSGLALIEEPKIEEVPRFFKFEKQHFTSQHPSYANLNYDPFPDKKYDDIVRTEIVGRDLVIRAKLKGPVVL